MELAYYFFWSNISLALFYLFYILILKGETFFMLNRIYLLAAILLSMLIPLLDTSDLFFVSKVGTILPDFSVIGYAESAITLKQNLNWFSIIYWSGTLISGTTLIVRLAGIKRALKGPANGSAFSFWRTKVIDPVLSDIEAIEGHEAIHIKQLHTIDILFIELVGVFFWFNPVVYLYKINLKLIHEYLADELAAVLAGSKKKYAMLLFCQNFKASPDLANAFITKSKLKLRISMLQKKRSERRSLWKYSFCLPLFLILVLCASFNQINFSAADKNTVLTKPASFPGGFSAFRSYLINTSRKISGKNGKVIVGFSVETNGRVVDEHIVEGMDEARNNEAIRLIKMSPDWESALQKGKAVRSDYQIGINFSN